MKRSEMIKILSKAYVKYESERGGYIIGDMIDNLLKRAEEAGMLPPEIIVEHDDHHEIGMDGVLTIEIGDEYIHEWESEDA